MFQEFKTFIARGSVLDLAVGVIIGAAFGKIVTALTDDIIMPVIGQLTGGMDFTNEFLILGDVPADFKGSLSSYADLKAAGVAMLGYGSFVTAVINFLIMAFVIFLIVRQANRVMPPPPAGPSEVDLLTEIRDALKKG
ncbi:MAG: large conductance mechanosensitive channel protein MscL [Novosphingobium sp.]